MEAAGGTAPLVRSFDTRGTRIAALRARVYGGAVPIRLHPVARRIAGLQLAVVAASAPLYPLTGLTFAWDTALRNLLLLGLLFAVWTWYAGRPATENREFAADALLATFLLVLFTNIVGPAQYAGVALALPLADPWLASADAALGIDVPALTAWTAGHPVLARALIWSYFTLLPQFVLPLLVLGIAYKDREALWEYVFHFHACLVVTLLGVTLLPAACAFTYYGFTSLLDQARFISHFEGLRAGTFTEIRFDDIEGLISFPSFHVAGGMMVTWVFRRRRRWLLPLAALNTMMIAATVLTGAHYGVDLLFTVLLFSGSVLLWRQWGRRGL